MSAAADVSSRGAEAAPRWRPLGQADADWLRERAAPALRAWQDEWFDAGAFDVLDAQAFAPGQACADGGACWRAGASLAAQTEPGAWKRHALAAMALSAQADAQVPEALLAPLQAQMLDALLARLADALADSASGARAGFERTLPGDGAGFAAGGVRLRIGTARDPQLLDLYCAAELAWTRPLSAAPAAKPAAPAARAEALGDNPVRLSAVLGRCRLTALQLSELAVGDVLTTAQSLHEPIALRLHADGVAPRTIAHGRPGRAQQRLSIELTTLQQKRTP
ncbi:FliM/FliN family flagellar motor C-terminal domain-containing protein [Lysobacter yananisis]|uniref:FliM/FliN family flagellar motor C-terminal domain-containing protein n=1 Tax=Lysobacter yananisis TaxID=1003114 RepID=A0ABY9PDJ6_9GAMM|nr:FliM/FliN family flagellar motor C-terminal domain-containing protein [Lysobacter yananisis]WMT05150.1 FliM/FliN family flagellar motor C-terminal domain-containing protein [Lysobacter yananisis]